MGDTTTTVKKCNKCGQLKDSSGFHKRKSATDGLQSVCKACIKAYQQNPSFPINKQISPKGAALAKKAIDVVEALPTNDYNINKAFADVTHKDIKKNKSVYQQSRQLWDDLSNDETALSLFRSYIANDMGHINLQGSFTNYFIQAMQEGSLGEKNQALSLTFKVMGWLDKASAKTDTANIKSPEERKAARAAYMQQLSDNTN